MSLSQKAFKSKVVIAGGSGFLGQLLVSSFLKDSYDVVILSRNHSSISVGGRVVHWNAKSTDEWTDELEGAQILINLTGRSIDCRHTSFNRVEIINSRVQSTRVLAEALHSCKKPPSVWLNASSMALYGQCFGSDAAHDENSPICEDGFLERVTTSWENEFSKFQSDEVRQIALRISFILGRKSGAFPILRKLSSLGLGGKQGSGMQWISWLHEDDWTRVVRFLCSNNDISGPVNLTSPNPIRNEDFMKTLREFVAPFRFGLPAPKFGVSLGCFFLGSAPELALQSRRVISRVLPSRKFEFKYPLLKDALKALCL